ncbi:tRNA (adenosine(37)-N6)-threonylcarbamoyltransferase complex dimerization subunit type 1 TsaB [Caldimonas tepidiphila]|uniref:tRNA (adenosine(37)-N6)-threonylcarbamoyltransferase complex dimerization subunit type 1 TsaB n=1 Tax=Caldimonas tepidiphila TaxID=2315841 RepID=UPI000E5C1ADC|nr:tRNA (adenosine(37)-N6)-threonylcarbamoyltransferase complex dimerization subunit type 1 TsaB [Caldimonas tepidiphila]
MNETRPARVLAIETATSLMSIAVAVDDAPVHLFEAAGGAQASAALLPAIERLLAESGMTLAQLDAIAFGRGPGAFTGLRTACAVAQGLAFGAEKPVLAIDTLMVVAEDARAAAPGLAEVWAATDARMGEVYAARYRHDGARWRTLDAPALYAPAALAERIAASPAALAGDALLVHGDALAAAAPQAWPDARPHAAALVALARAAWRDGEALDAAEALPLYIRDKVAQTTAEREAERARRAQEPVA